MCGRRALYIRVSGIRIPKNIRINIELFLGPPEKSGSKKAILGEGRKEGRREEGREGGREGGKKGRKQIRKSQLHHVARAMRNSRSSQTPVSLLQLRIARFIRNLEKTVFAPKMLSLPDLVSRSALRRTAPKLRAYWYILCRAVCATVHRFNTYCYILSLQSFCWRLDVCAFTHRYGTAIPSLPHE